MKTFNANFLILSGDKRMTDIMQDCDVFEKGKFFMEPSEYVVKFETEYAEVQPFFNLKELIDLIQKENGHIAKIQPDKLTQKYIGYNKKTGWRTCRVYHENQIVGYINAKMKTINLENENL